MGAYTYSEFKSYLKLQLGNNDAWDLYLGPWINSAYRLLTTADIVWGVRKRLFFPELETSSSATTVDGTGYVAVPSDCLVVREIFDGTNEVRLDWISWPDYIGKTDRADTSAESTPSYWSRSGSSLYLYPTPDAAYSLTIHYKKRVTDLSGASDVTVIGKEWDDVILEMATFFARNRLNEPERAEYAKKNAVEMISGLVTIYGAEERARREAVRPSEVSDVRSTY
jgi:hypothetical protein